MEYFNWGWNSNRRCLFFGWTQWNRDRGKCEYEHGCIYTEQHDINDPWFESRNSGGKVIVANRAWLSSRTTVLPKVVVGEGAVLASGGLAVKNLEPYGVYGGVPAKKIGTRNQNLKYEFSGAYLPFY